MWQSLAIWLVLLIHIHGREEFSGADQTSPNDGKRHHVKMKYRYGNWRPHFGYRRSHDAADHGSRYARSLSEGSVPIDLKRYLVRLMVHENLVCSGLIVNRQQVLTASVCLLDVRPETVMVRLFDGSSTRVREIRSSSEASEFSVTGASGLLTLIQLSNQLPNSFERSPPICGPCPKKNDNVGLWTWDREGQNLTIKNVKVAPALACKSQIKDPDGIVINNATICLENTEYSVGCMSNFGLPYVWRNEFCGINILGHNCPSPSNVDVYVRLRGVRNISSM
ncbi:hypothetical protein KR018_004725 [Drosophila ironensis]|nr:hypothetical protein KR018_004725 [Drosophila ironensis]